MTSISRIMFFMDIYVKKAQSSKIIKLSYQSDNNNDLLFLCKKSIEKQALNNITLDDYLYSYNNMENVLKSLPSPYDTIIDNIKLTNEIVIGNEECVLNIFKRGNKYIIELINTYRGKYVQYVLYCDRVKISIID
jgi:hypothetical protein